MGSFKIFLKENEDMLQQIFDILDEMNEEELDEFGYFLYYEFFDEEGTEEGTEEEEFDIDDVKAMIAELGVDMYEEILELLTPEELELTDIDVDEFEGGMDESLNEDWVKLSTVKPDEVKKIRTTRSGKNYFYVVGVDTKSKEYEVLTPKNYEKNNTSKPLYVAFSDVALVSTDEYDEMGEAVSRKIKTKNLNKKKRKFMSKTKADLRRTLATRKRTARKTRSKKKRYYRANKVKIKSYQASRSAAIKKGKHFTKVRRNA